jgi:uncharacterized protein (DUF58 family)
MDRRDLLRKINTFPIVARDLAEDLLAGDFRSVFRGEGIEFDEVRRYEIGDDVRSIDWNVSARFGLPYVKMYREERELTVALVLDCSASMRSGEGASAAGAKPDRSTLTRYDQGVLAAALIAFSAERAGQRVGALFFDQETRTIFSPRKGRSHVMAVISAALSPAGAGKGSSLGTALSGIGRLLKRRSLVVVISDFLSVNWERELGDLCKKHDVIALRITSPLDTAMPKAGLLTMEDGETGLRIHAPTGFAAFRSAWAQWHEDRSAVWRAICRRSGAAMLELSTAGDAPAALARFFGGRWSRSRRRVVPPRRGR